MTEYKRVNLASVNELKNNSDELISSVLEHNYKQNYTLIDTKLVLIYISIAISAATFYLDKKFKNDFHNQFYYNTTAWLTVSFYVFTALTYLYSTRVAKDIKFVGTDSRKNTLTISTKVSKDHDPHYHITVDLNGKKLEVSKHFTELYNKEGYLQLIELKKTIDDQVNILKRAKS